MQIAARMLVLYIFVVGVFVRHTLWTRRAVKTSILQSLCNRVSGQFGRLARGMNQFFFLKSVSIIEKDKHTKM